MIPSDKGLEPLKSIANTNLCIAYGRSGIGGRHENQDSHSGMPDGDNVILTVCDGMGGMNGGQTASRIAMSEIINYIMDRPHSDWREETVANAIGAANTAVYKKSMMEPRLRGMGTTTTVLMLTKEAAFLAHIGDSRIYQLRKGKKYFRTFDHSKVFEMVGQRMMTEEQARCSSFSNIITRALGIRPQVEVTVSKLPYKKGDRFVLCSDGIWNCLPEAQVLELFNREKATDKEVSFLTETVNGIGFEKGGEHDNLTVIVADMNCDSDFQYSVFRPLGMMFSKMNRGSKRIFRKAAYKNHTK